MKNTFIIVWISVLLFSCAEKKKDTLFRKHDAAESGLAFNNTITESDSLNAFNNLYMYNGGGVGLADFNNDGLTDIVFTGNMVSCQLYINKGELKFLDVSKQAGIVTSTWVNGVTVVDVNQDGWMDIYFSVGLFDKPLQSENLLFVHQGLDNGIPQFKEMAKEYGLTVSAFSVQADFFDYDRDGDLDMFQLVNGYVKSRSNNSPRIKDVHGESITIDKLYRNEGIGANGHPIFKDVTLEANLLIEGYGLGMAITDINDDGWPDVYAANDFITDDLLWINNRDGTFSNKAHEYFKHQSFNSMGIDIADYNNDGLQDIFVVDMEPEDNFRKKMMSTGPNYKKYQLAIRYGYELQYVRNVLQLNNGISSEGKPSYSEIGQLAGVHQTDWSWSPLFADFDNDGWRDLFVSNGYRKDITDLDFIVYDYEGGAFGSNNQQSGKFKDNVKNIPEIKLPSYAFHNNKDLTFENVSAVWGLDELSYSNGAAYADLDNDGDLDLIVNNIDEPAFLYENQTQQKHPVHFLKIKLQGAPINKAGLGAKISLRSSKGLQVYEHRTTRGYLSAMEGPIHFGLGNRSSVDTVEVIWPDGKTQNIYNVKANQILIINYSNAIENIIPKSTNVESPLITEVSKKKNIHYRHHEKDFVDFDINRLIPHKLSQYGPSVSVGDINGDGLDDFFIGGSKDYTAAFFIQQSSGKFSQREFEFHKRHEDVGSLLFDADGDHDLDLYVVSGSVEYFKEAEEFQDRLYSNDGKGNFRYQPELLPEMRTNGSCVKAADFDADGDLDLFVGGHVIPGQYPMPDKSYLLQNNNGKFTDVTEKLAPGLSNIGLVMDALWTDADNDGKVDLLVVGEWMPITFFKNVEGRFINETSYMGLSSTTGWWNSLVSGDFDRDGDMDYVAGNLGLNSAYKVSDKEPMELIVKDIDQNGSIDPILTYYVKGSSGIKESHVALSRDQLVSQLPYIKGRFKTYSQYAKASLNEIFPQEKLKDASVLQSTCLSSSLIENLGDGKFSIRALPIDAQFAPIFGMKTNDFNNDGNLDLMAVGNFYGPNVQHGQYDALNGLLLLGDGAGNFLSSPKAHGFYVSSDAKAISTLHDKAGNELLIVSSNQDSVKVFEIKKSTSAKHFIRPSEFTGEIVHKDGKREMVEFYYGCSYLSQGPRHFYANEKMKSVRIKDYKGNVRIIDFSSVNKKK